MDDRIAISQTRNGDQMTLALTGNLNENAEFPQLDVNGVREVVLDLSGIKMLNSVGLRSWLLWIKTFAQKTGLVFVNCPRHVVDQMNILDGFLPTHARVDSFFVPYFCESCDATESILARRGQDFMEGTADTREGVTLPDERPCPHCQKPMEMDVLRDRYFSFLKYRK